MYYNKGYPVMSTPPGINDLASERNRYHEYRSDSSY